MRILVEVHSGESLNDAVIERLAEEGKDAA